MVAESPLATVIRMIFSFDFTRVGVLSIRFVLRFRSGLTQDLPFRVSRYGVNLNLIRRLPTVLPGRLRRLTGSPL